jgi:hypothetical protein
MTDKRNLPPEEVSPAPMRGRGPAARGVVVVLDGSPRADDGFRVHAPDRVLRIWALLKAVARELHEADLPPGALPRLERTLEEATAELERSVSPALAAELHDLIPQHEVPPGADELRIECTALLAWTGGLAKAILSEIGGERKRQDPGRRPGKQQGHPQRARSPQRPLTGLSRQTGRGDAPPFMRLLQPVITPPGLDGLAARGNKRSEQGRPARHTGQVLRTGGPGAVRTGACRRVLRTGLAGRGPACRCPR